MMKRVLSVCLFFALWWTTGSALSQDSSKGQTAAGGTAPEAASSSKTESGNSAADIAAAKAAHKVWVNLDTGIYHKNGRWYGKTKNGKFMTEDEARKAGYKTAKRN